MASLALNPDKSWREFHGKLCRAKSASMGIGGMGEWLKPAVLKSDQALFGKFLKIQHNLCPASSLQSFQSSFLISRFHPF